MQLVITYEDSTTEIIHAAPQADIVSVGMSFRPGIVLLNEPINCFLGCDFFSAAINEGNLRFGEEVPFDDEDLQSRKRFRWEVLGSEIADCQDMIVRWIMRLGAHFDPYDRAENYLYEGILLILDEEEARSYENDQKCWMFYLDDPRADAAHRLLAEGFQPLWSLTKKDLS